MTARTVRAHILRPRLDAPDLDRRLRILLRHVLPPKAGGLTRVGDPLRAFGQFIATTGE